MANKVEHPTNVYLAEKDVLPAVDSWPATAFAPHRLESTLNQMFESQPETTTDPDRDLVDMVIAECDEKLARYRQALEAGTDPVLMARWTAEVQARKAEAQSKARARSGRQRMTREEIRTIVTPGEATRSGLMWTGVRGLASGAGLGAPPPGQ